MNHREIAGLMAAIAPTIGDFVGKAMAPLRAENERLTNSLAAVEQRFADFSAARENDRVVFLTLVKEEIAKVEPSAVDPVEIERVVNEKVEKAVSALPVPENGKDAEPVDLDEVASRAVKLLPVPENGRDADPEAIKAAVLDVVAEILPGEVSAAVEKIEKPADGKDVDPAHVEMLVRLVVGEEVGKIDRPKDGRDGVDGKSVTLDDVAPLIEEAVSKIVVPEGPQGLPGEAGKSVSIEDVKPLLEEMVAALPKAENGKDADPAEVAALILEDVAKLIPVPENGKSVTIDDVIPVIEDVIEKKVSALPRPKDGIDGRDGKDGIGLAGALLGRSGDLVLTLSDGTANSLGVIVGKDGEPGLPGRDGVDGLGFDDLEVIHDGERSFTFRYQRGEVVKEQVFTVPAVLDRGVFKEAREQPYEKGDGVTFGGSFWIAQKDAPEGKPQDGSKDWRLSVKRGRDGKDGVVKMIPPQGPVKSSS